MTGMKMETAASIIQRHDKLLKWTDRWKRNDLPSSITTVTNRDIHERQWRRM